MAQIADVIKYEGDNNTFVWKHPSEDFNSLTQLIVHESQEAVFFLNGEGLDIMGPGRHTLETQNIPKISKFLKRVTGDSTPFHCEVYFINKTEQMAIKWGTDSRVQYTEPTYHVPVSLGACGELSLRIDNSRKILLKLVGTESELSREKLVDYFKSFLMTRIKSYIAQTMVKNDVNIFDIDSKLSVFSDELRGLLVSDFADYGVVLEKFLVTSISKPDGDENYERLKKVYMAPLNIEEANIESTIRVINANTRATEAMIGIKTHAAENELLGISEIDRERFGILTELAKNPGSGSDIRNAAMGIGIGVGAGGVLGNAMNNVVGSAMGGFPGMSGMGQQPRQNDIPEMINLKNENSQPSVSIKSEEDEMKVFQKKIDKLKMLHDSGIISDDEFVVEKNKLLSSI